MGFTVKMSENIIIHKKVIRINVGFFRYDR